ncbi:septum formation initiator family protein [bacterium]|nr:septum formation initiator family protein [bacterium]
MQYSARPKPERVPPRRRRPKRSVWRKIVWPLVKVSVIVALVLFVVGKVTRPFRLYSREYRETKQIALQLDALRKENAALERQIKYLKTAEGSAQAARKLGWVKPGEITLVLPDSNSKDQRK